MGDPQLLQWTIIGVAITLGLLIISIGGVLMWGMRLLASGLRAEIKAETAAIQGTITNLETGLRAEIAGSKAELRVEIAETRAEIAETKSELKADIVGLRTELKADIVEVRTELKADIAELRTDVKADIASLSRDVIDNRRMIARFALHRHGDDGLPTAPLTDSLDPPGGTSGSSSNGEGDDD